MTIENATKPTVAQRLHHELKEYLTLAAYLYVCFSALVFYKLTIMDMNGISYAPFGVPIIKALILGKFILLGHMAGLGGRYTERRVISIIASKALLYLALLIVLSVVEEAVMALIHGQTVIEAFSEAWSGKLWQIVATSFIVLLVLIPYMAVRELNESLDGRLWAMLMEKRTTARSAT